MTTAPITSIRSNHEDRTVEELIRDAHLLLINCGVAIGPSKVSRLVRDFKQRVERNGFPFEQFLVNSVQLTEQQRRQALAHPDIARVIAHADPTGEDAVVQAEKTDIALLRECPACRRKIGARGHDCSGGGRAA